MNHSHGFFHGEWRTCIQHGQLWKFALPVQVQLLAAETINPPGPIPANNAFRRYVAHTESTFEPKLVGHYISYALSAYMLLLSSWRSPKGSLRALASSHHVPRV